MTTGGNNRRDDPGGGERNNPGGYSQDEVELKLPALPPVIFGIPIVTGALVHLFVWQGGIFGGAAGPVIGVFLIIVGLWMIYWTWRVMRAHGEHPEPRHATETLVTNGPFRRTRNPIYVGFLLIGAGLAVSLNAMAVLAAVLFAVVALTVLVIRKEEAYLEHKFGEVYHDYASKTRRWL